MAVESPRVAAFLACAGITGIAGLAVLFFFDPATAGIYPPCLFRTVLGGPCPGCGALRAAHQLLHGNFREAWALNPTLMIVGPLAAALTLFTYLRKSSSTPPPT